MGDAALYEVSRGAENGLSISAKEKDSDAESMTPSIRSKLSTRRRRTRRNITYQFDKVSLSDIGMDAS